MSTSILSGVDAYIMWAKEATYGTAVTVNKPFGLAQSLSNVQINSNPLPLPKLGSVDVESFAFGRYEGQMSVGWTLSAPWFFDSFLKEDTSAHTDHTDSSAASSYTWESKPKGVESITVEVGVDSPTTDIVRTFRGCVMQEWSLQSQINQYVQCQGRVAFSQEATTTTRSTIVDDDIEYPHRFTKGTVKLNGTAVGRVQSVNLSVNTGAEQLFEMNKAAAIGYKKGLLEITGSMSMLLENDTIREDVADQEEQTSMEIKFDNGQSNEKAKSVTLSTDKLALSTQSMSRISPNDVIMEDVNFQWANLKVVAEAGDIDSIP